MENQPQGNADTIVESRGKSAEELLAITGEIPVQLAKRIEKEPQPEKLSDPRYVAEVRLMKRSRDFLIEKRHLKHEGAPGVEPGDDTVESSLREAYEEGAGLDEQQVLFAHVMIDSHLERRREQALAQHHDALSQGQVKNLKRAQAYFRSELRNVVSQSEGGIRQDDLTAWLTEFGGSAEWASKVVDEEAAKIALHKYLDGRRDLHVEYASAEESAAEGYDLDVIPYQEVLGGPMKVKAKPVGAPEGDVRSRHGIIEMEVPRAQIEDFEFKSAQDAEGLAEMMSKAGRGTKLVYSSESRS